MLNPGGTDVQIKGIVFVSRRSDDPGALADFLHEKVGLPEPTRVDTGPYVFELESGDMLALHQSDPSAPNGSAIIGFLVDDVERASSELDLRGVELIGPLFTGVRVRWQHFRGPDGVPFEILDERGKPDA